MGKKKEQLTQPILSQLLSLTRTPLSPVPFLAVTPTPRYIDKRETEETERQRGRERHRETQRSKKEESRQRQTATREGRETVCYHLISHPSLSDSLRSLLLRSRPQLELCLESEELSRLCLFRSARRSDRVAVFRKRSAEWCWSRVGWIGVC